MRERVGQRASGSRCARGAACAAGVTLIELMIVLAIIAILASIGIPMVRSALAEAKAEATIQEIRGLEKEIMAYETRTGELPDSLAAIGKGNLRDPWGRPYEYLRVADVKGKGKLRKDRFLVPLNSDYDLYSVGPDGKSVPPLTASHSHDDIVRANDGGYIGLASEY